MKYKLITIICHFSQWRPELVLEGHRPAEFCSNLAQHTYLPSEGVSTPATGDLGSWSFQLHPQSNTPLIKVGDPRPPETLICCVPIRLLILCIWSMYCFRYETMYIYILAICKTVCTHCILCILLHKSGFFRTTDFIMLWFVVRHDATRTAQILKQSHSRYRILYTLERAR